MSEIDCIKSKKFKNVVIGDEKNGALFVSGKEKLDGDLSVSNSTTLVGALNVDGRTNINNLLSISTDAFIVGNTTIQGKLSLGGKMNLSGGLNIFGRTNLDGTLSVANKAYLSDANIRGNLWVDGSVNINNTLIVDGNLGIGTDDPQSNIHISSGTSGDCILTLEADTDNNNEGDNCFIIFKQDGGEAQSAVYTTSNKLNISNSVNSDGGITFLTGTTNDYLDAFERMRISSNGNVGIGTDSPDSLLHVDGSIRAGYDTDTASYFGRTAIGISAVPDYASFSHLDRASTTNYALLQSALGSTFLNASSGQSIQFRIGNSFMMLIDNTGLGIGTLETKSKLDVAGNVAIGSTYAGTTAAPNNGLIVEGNVGIGKSSPNAKLDVEGMTNLSGGLNVKGTTNLMGTLSVKGPISLGDGTKALGINSVALGEESVANGRYSLAQGYQSYANGISSIAMGYQAKACGGSTINAQEVILPYPSISIGYQTMASSAASVAIGSRNTASGVGTLALGAESTAKGTMSITMGYQSTATGMTSTAIGREGRADANYAICISSQNSHACSERSIVIGEGLISRSGNEIVLGSYNTDHTAISEDGWALKDRLFTIGNGNGDVNERKDALVMLKSADTTLYGNMNIDKRLNVKGTTNLNGNLRVNGNTNLRGNLHIGGNLQNQGVTNLANTLFVYPANHQKSGDAGGAHVNITGNLFVSGRVNISGSLNVSSHIACGSISKGSGTFKIDHPVPQKSKTHWLYHSFVESPTTGDNIYRYNIETNNKTHVIQLEEYHKYLNTNYQAWVNPDRHFGRGYGYVENNNLYVEVDIDGKYNILLIGTRKDKLALENWNGVEVEK